MDTFLLVSTIIISILLLIINIYLLALYIHPDDRGFGASLFPKILVVVGLTLSWGQVLMISLDISNTRGYGAGMNLDALWQTGIILSFLFLIILIPFAIFFYETDEQKAFRQRFGNAASYSAAVLICFIIVLIITFNMFGTINMPVSVGKLKAADLESSSSLLNFEDLKTKAPKGNMMHLVLSANFWIFLLAFFAFIGWVLLVFFGGMGLFAIPMDYINTYRDRPIKRSKQEILFKKGNLQDNISELVQMGQGIEDAQKDVESARGLLAKRSAQAKVNKEVNKFKASVLSLENEFQIFSAEVNYHTINPFAYTSQLYTGIILLVVSLIWWLHILFNVIHDKNGYAYSQFLSNILLFFEEKFDAGFVSIGLFSVLAVYIIIAVTKGNVKFGLKIPFFFTIHPMAPNETLMNSFLFNMWLIMMTSIAVVSFMAESFSQYTRLTSVAFLFSVQVKHMKFFNFFFANRIFETAFLVWSVLTLFCLLFCERRKTTTKKKNVLLAD